MINNIAVLINTKNRVTELSLLLQSLRTQTYQKFDIFVYDDYGDNPNTNYHFFNCLITRLKLEDHFVFMRRTEFPHGVSKARQAIVDWALQYDYEYFCRLDDDCILESDYIEKLLNVIENGYDLATGVTVPMVGPSFKRDSKFISNGIMNRVILDNEGNYILNNDDCGMEYLKTDNIFPAHHFRSCALYKTEIHKKVNYLPTRLSMHGFREEQIFSYKLLLNGYKIGCDLNAVTWHQLTPSGGERGPNDQELIRFNEQILNEWTKDHKDELNKIFTKENMSSELELMKETNLAGRIK